jgi:UDP-glucose 4-epimerase
MRVLITGATGFVGRYVLDRLAARHEVIALTRRPPPAGLGSVRWIEHDFSARETQPRWPPRVDAIVHLAQSGGYRDFPRSAPDIFAVGADAPMRLLNYAREAGVRKFILASTGGLYGWSDRPVRESDAVTLESGSLGFYFAVKRASELLAEQYVGLFGVTVLRFFFVYGPGQSSEKLLPRLVQAVTDGRPIQLQGSDGIRINPIHVEDAAAAVARCLEIDAKGAINIAGPEIASLRQVGSIIGQTLGVEPIFETESHMPSRHLVADITRMRELVWTPTIALRQGIATICGEAAARV